MPTPVVIVTANGRPITNVSGGVPMTPVEASVGGEPVILVDSGGEPVTLVNADLSLWNNLLNDATTYLGGIEPYHWFDYVNNQALYASEDVGTVSDPTGYSFSRASSGYYTNSDGTLTSFGSGVLRRGDRGVLIEGARTNLALRSQELDDGGWLRLGSAVTANNLTAPDLTATADTFTEDGSSSRHIFYRAITTVASTVYTNSIIAKAGTRSVIAVGLRGTDGVTGYASTFDLSNGTLGTANSTGSPTSTNRTIEALSDGWYRCSVTMAAGTTSTFVEYGLSSTTSPTWFAGMPTYLGNSTGSCGFWGAQLEAGSHVSSYIPTTSASATRAADVLTYAINSSAEIAAAVASETELVTNGGFDADSDWTKSATAPATTTISGGSLNINSPAGETSSATQDLAGIVAGNIYAVTIDVTRTSGDIYVGFGTTITGPSRYQISSTGTHTFLLEASGTVLGRLYISRVAAAVYAVNSISVKAIPANSLTLYPLTLWAEFERAVDTGVVEAIVAADAGADSSQALLYVSSIDFVRAFLTNTTTQADVVAGGAASISTVYRAAGRFATDDVNVARSGTAGTADTAATLPSNPTTLRIGSRASTSQCFGYISRIAIIQGAQSDANLQTMTT